MSLIQNDDGTIVVHFVDYGAAIVIRWVRCIQGSRMEVAVVEDVEKPDTHKILATEKLWKKKSETQTPHEH